MKSITAENKYALIIASPSEKNNGHFFLPKKSARSLSEKNTFFINSNREPLSIKITAGMVWRWKVKQQVKRDSRAYFNKPAGDLLFLNALKLSMANKANGGKPWWVALELYWAGYARGIREQRQRARKKVLSAFDIINADDIRELSSEIGINEDKITNAVLEVISKRKNGGYQ